MIRISFGILCNTEQYRNPIFQFEIAFESASTIDWEMLFHIIESRMKSLISYPFPNFMTQFLNLEELRDNNFVITYSKWDESESLTKLLKDLQQYLLKLQIKLKKNTVE